MGAFQRDEWLPVAPVVFVAVRAVMMALVVSLVVVIVVFVIVIGPMVADLWCRILRRNGDRRWS